MPIQDNFITDFNKLSASNKSVIAANAASQGITPQQYLTQRGGVEATTSKYGDSYNPKTDLTAAEYAAVIADAKAKGLTGVAIGQAINAATAEKQGMSLFQYTGGAQGGNNSSNINSGESSQAAAMRYAADLQAQAERDRVTAERQSAYAILESEFTKYGLGDLAKTVKDLILAGTPSAEATIKLRNTKEYQTRFAGNETRRTLGKNVYSEDVYLQLENQMQEAFAAYGVSSVLGSSRANQQAKLATFIGADIAPTEVKKRIQMAVEEVNNRPEILKTFQTYYPSVTDKDLVSYFLDPKETETRLTTKVQAAQIGSAATRQGLVTNVLSAEELAALGVTEAAANVGYTKVAQVLPTAIKLGEIEGTGFTQAEAEGAYLKGLASEQRKLSELAAREQNRFLGASGASKGAYASGYLNRTSSAGQY